ncbi:hypothetical protein RZS08_01960, partial [Arthrospira platensis SPKY1]|nr:hypothetical protein [Arthrospira platensis SPKY1]
SWQRIVVQHATGTDRRTESDANRSLALDEGEWVRVQYAKAEYGLYEYVGPGGSVDLSTQDFANTSLWRRIEVDGATNSGTLALESGMLISNKFRIESLVLRVAEDVNIGFN